MDDLLRERFVRDLHHEFYTEIWTWAGGYRRREVNLGVAPELIATQLRAFLETVRYRWEHTNDFSHTSSESPCTPNWCGSIPAPTGTAAPPDCWPTSSSSQSRTGDIAELYDWKLEKRRYIHLLHEYDRHRDPTAVAAFITTQPLDR